jgi:hypothetical protein
MGKAGRWLKSIIAGRKDGGGKKALPPRQQQGDATPLPAASSGSPREKKRWSFRRPATAAAQQGNKAALAPSPLSSSLDGLDPEAAGLAGVSMSARDLDQNEHAVAVAVAAAAAADAAVMAAAEAAAAVARLTEPEEESDVSVTCAIEDAAAARIQATFRGYLVSESGN